ncbi:MAG: M28 family peptidase [Thermoanaerobaculia bacterium]
MALWAQKEAGNPKATPEFSGGAVKDHVRYLASDELEGRATGTEGGRLAAAYVEAQFERIGLGFRPGTETYRQNVPLFGSVIETDSLGLELWGADTTPTFTDQDFTIRTELVSCSKCEVTGEVVFAGYGMSAPEYGWDAYGDRAVAGKILLMLPDVPEAAQGDLPGGGASYYGRDENKLQEARIQGAAGVLFLMEPGHEERFNDTAAEWALEFVQRGWGRGHPLAVIGWLSPKASGQVLAAAGTSYEAAVAKAVQPEFEAWDLGVSAKARFTQAVRRFSSSNIVGVVPGTDGEKGTVVVTAHWDHLGTGTPDDTGDAIYNGAKDNASGVAGLILLADALKSAGAQRNVVFVATAAEESDFEQIGARYYLEHPAYPIEETVLNLNLDGLAVVWPTGDFRILPVRATSAEHILAALAQPLDKVISVAGWQPSLHFSFDTVEFMARGIPGLTLWGGSQFRAKGMTVEELKERYGRMGGRIHEPSDRFHEDWSERAIEEHLELYWAALTYWANGAAPPAIDPLGPLGPLLKVGQPPYRALARKIVERLALKPREKVLLLCHPTRFQEIVPHLRYEVMKAGGINLGCLQVLPQPFPRGWDRQRVTRGFTQSREAMAEIVRGADALVALPGAWPNQSAYLAAQDVLRSGHGRIVHFHWLGGYSLSGQQLPVTARLDDTYVRAVLNTDHHSLAEEQRHFAEAARRGELHVTTPAGTDIRFRVGGERPVTIQDGDASANRATQARLLVDREIEIPAGAVRFAPLEPTVEGVIVFPDSYWSGEFVRAPRLVFSRGKVTAISAAGNEDAVRDELRNGGDAARHLRAFALGFNPHLAVPEDDPWVPYYGYGAGVVRLSLGQNSDLGGDVEGEYSRWNFFIDATVDIDGERWVEEGRLLSQARGAGS